MTRFEKSAVAVFVAATLAELSLGVWRAQLLRAAPAPAFALAGVIAAVGALWFVRRRGMRGAFLAKPVALIFATVAVISGTSAMNAPFLSIVTKFSTPLFALSAAALLVLAEADARVQVAPLIAFLISVAALQIALTGDARWEAGSRLAAGLTRYEEGHFRPQPAPRRMR